MLPNTPNLRDDLQERELAGENVNLTMREFAARRTEISPEVQASAEAFTARYGNNVGEFFSKDEPAEDRVQMLHRGRELTEQEQFEAPAVETRWTLQQFSTNPVGDPWYALQQHDESGVQRMVTGTRKEVDEVIAEHKLNVTELPPITEGEFYRQALGSMGLEPEIRREEGLSVSV